MQHFFFLLLRATIISARLLNCVQLQLMTVQGPGRCSLPRARSLPFAGPWLYVRQRVIKGRKFVLEAEHVLLGS
uniref:Putative secreted protein n=1 Tax=Ixodes ricinus TaxID=34613 RepID=A0A6B0U352_IXORI